ncbi:DAK2 domain-containing protein [Clostridium sp. AF18-27]|uniref:DAK2 domain-containing protein n=1 Tax=Enterocloster TaxID=2719313 RepID=UPI000E555171|nr:MULTISPECIES: DAK2 domain-containing protein [Enterocloster]MBS5607937.1 DAK2 domain-containing protein [Enterocloster asparagiformis]MCB6344594.1 DAK2 domain-containing protein [Enterocloster lavalensis]MDR3758935.1 DAK2 domain-containing protein [Enterocloster sp.]RHR49670.1 DAK2 domain-containing protein [Clostridium sp. AF18-27]
MLLSKPEIEKMFHKVAEIWQENKDYLSEIDSRFGDGDHGVTIGKIASLIEKKLAAWEDDDIEEFLEDLGDSTMEIGGGSAGPLYGTLIGGLSGPLSGGGAIGEGLLKEMFTECQSAMEDITNAKVGDKTMMDALIPAVAAAEAAEGDCLAILEAAKEAAARGAKESEQYVSKFGRARSYKEQTIGTPDAGAVSTSLFFAGLCDGLK